MSETTYVLAVVMERERGVVAGWLTGLKMVLSRSGYLATERDSPIREPCRLDWLDGSLREKLAWSSS